MPSVADLRNVLRDLESDHHDVGGILASVTSPRRHARWPAVAVAAASVVALLLGTVMFMRHDRSTGQQAATPPTVFAPDLLNRYLFVVTAVPAGLRLVYQGATGTSQHAALVGANGESSVDVSVDLPTSPSLPVPSAAANQVTINAYAGLSWIAPTFDAASHHPDGTIETIAWIDRSGLTVSVAVTRPTHPAARAAAPLTHDQAIGIARSVSIGAAGPVRTPLGVGYLPVGYRVQGVSVTMTGNGTAEANVDLVYGAGPNVALQVMLGVYVTPAKRPDSRAVTIGAFTGTYSSTAVATVLSDGRHAVEVYYNAGESGGSGTGTNLSIEEVGHIVQGLRIAATPSDPNTWFDAVTALPR